MKAWFIAFVCLTLAGCGPQVSNQIARNVATSVYGGPAERETATAPQNPAVWQGQFRCGRSIVGDTTLNVRPERGAPQAPDGWLAMAQTRNDTRLGIVRITGQRWAFEVYGPDNQTLTGQVPFRGIIEQSGLLRYETPGLPCQDAVLRPVPSRQMSQFLTAAFGSAAGDPSAIPTDTGTALCRNQPLGPSMVDGRSVRTSQATVAGGFLYYDRCAELVRIPGQQIRPSVILGDASAVSGGGTVRDVLSGRTRPRAELRPVAFAEYCAVGTTIELARTKYHCKPDGYRYRRDFLICLGIPVDANTIPGRIGAAAVLACGARMTSFGLRSPFVRE